MKENSYLLLLTVSTSYLYTTGLCKYYSFFSERANHFSKANFKVLQDVIVYEQYVDLVKSGKYAKAKDYLSKQAKIYEEASQHEEKGTMAKITLYNNNINLFSLVTISFFLDFC
jgi:hypothetical protein